MEHPIERPEENNEGIGRHSAPAQQHKPKKKKTGWAILLIVILLGAGGGGYYYYYIQKEQAALQAILDSDTIYPGITINGYDVNGMTREEAVAYLEEQLHATEDRVHLTYEDQSWDYSYQDLGISYGIAETVEKGYAINRTGSDEERRAGLKDLKEAGQALTVSVAYDQEAIQKAVDDLAVSLDVEPENAHLVKQGDDFVIEGGTVGIIINKTKAVSDIIAGIEAYDTGNIALSAVEKKPALTKDVFDFKISLLGTYTTQYTGGDSGRNTNLKVGCEYITGTVLMPGETFSMNEALGEQTWERGYRNAAVIVDGKLEQGLGGGVCQITTTVYNAVIRAELDVVERHNHSLAVGYIPSGLDAAIAGNYKDLKFKNNTDHPIYLEASAVNGKLTANIYGYETHDAGHSVEFERVYGGSIPQPAEKITEDPDKYEDEREVTYTGKAGFKMTVYKVTYENGIEVNREWFSDSTYRAVADEVTVGTKTRETMEASTNGTAGNSEGGTAGATSPAGQGNATTGGNEDAPIGSN